MKRTSRPVSPKLALSCQRQFRRNWPTFYFARPTVFASIVHSTGVCFFTAAAQGFDVGHNISGRFSVSAHAGGGDAGGRAGGPLDGVQARGAVGEERLSHRLARHEQVADLLVREARNGMQKGRVG